MQSQISIPVGVVVAREPLDNPWQDHVWRPLGVFLNAPDGLDWRELRREGETIVYHAGTISIELHRKEAANYAANLADPPPVLYVVLRLEPRDGVDWPLHVHLVTASNTEVQAYGESGYEVIEPVPMLDDIVALVEAFVEEHHVEEPFKKRKRVKYVQEDEHKFGQEPIEVLRERMAARQQAAKRGGDDDGSL